MKTPKRAKVVRRKSPIDHIAATELKLFADNDADLYRQQKSYIEKNLAKRKAKGTYDPEKAVIAFGYLTDNAAKKYSKEFGQTEFTKSTRMEAARQMAKEWELEYNYTHGGNKGRTGLK